MLGAIIGDTIGSVYEFDNLKTKLFPLFIKGSQALPVMLTVALRLSRMQAITHASATNVTLSPILRLRSKMQSPSPMRSRQFGRKIHIRKTARQ